MAKTKFSEEDFTDILACELQVGHKLAMWDGDLEYYVVEVTDITRSGEYVFIDFVLPEGAKIWSSEDVDLKVSWQAGNAVIRVSVKHKKNDIIMILW